MATEVVQLSNLEDRVIRRIFDLRFPDAMPGYRQALAKYKRRLGNRREKEVHRPTEIAPASGIFVSQPAVGFEKSHMGETLFVERPREPKLIAWLYSPYDRSGGPASRAEEYGLLAGSAYNRQIRLERVREYRDVMQAGEWSTLLSDPISITEDGQVVNGQHRLAAASLVDWSKVGNDPSFLVVWGVSPLEAWHADGSGRTPTDEKTISKKISRAITRRSAA